MTGKIDNQLNLALNLSEQEREAAELDEGVNEDERVWELIIRYSDNLLMVREMAEEVKELLGGYAIVYARESMIESIAELEEVIFMEKPKRLYFEIEDGKAVSCILPLQRNDATALSGRGVLAAIIDSGERVIIMSS